eukprot:GEMP01036220.1.p1 GENE.GEMP01036220.1~~GEMP01036220.1.p1  ORF type:complete len:332 (+),score=61.86 GEMP01036220.1:24-998(+)
MIADTPRLSHTALSRRLPARLLRRSAPLVRRSLRHITSQSFKCAVSACAMDALSIPYAVRFTGGALCAGYGMDEAYVTPVLSLPFFVDSVALMARGQGAVEAALYVIPTTGIAFGGYLLARVTYPFLECVKMTKMVSLAEKVFMICAVCLSCWRVNGNFDHIGAGSFSWNDVHEHDQIEISLVKETISPLSRLFMGALMAVMGFNTAKWFFRVNMPYVVHNVFALSLGIVFRLFMSTVESPWIYMICAKVIACYVGSCSQSVALLEDTFVAVIGGVSQKDRKRAFVHLGANLAVCFAFGVLYAATHSLEMPVKKNRSAIHDSEA